MRQGQDKSTPKKDPPGRPMMRGILHGMTWGLLIGGVVILGAALVLETGEGAGRPTQQMVLGEGPETAWQVPTNVVHVPSADPLRATAAHADPAPMRQPPRPVPGRQVPALTVADIGPTPPAAAPRPTPPIASPGRPAPSVQVVVSPLLHHPPFRPPVPGRVITAGLVPDTPGYAGMPPPPHPADASARPAIPVAPEESRTASAARPETDNAVARQVGNMPPHQPVLRGLDAAGAAIPALAPSPDAVPQSPESIRADPAQPDGGADGASSVVLLVEGTTGADTPWAAARLGAPSSGSVLELPEDAWPEALESLGDRLKSGPPLTAVLVQSAPAPELVDRLLALLAENGTGAMIADQNAGGPLLARAMAAGVDATLIYREIGGGEQADIIAALHSTARRAERDGVAVALVQPSAADAVTQALDSGRIAIAPAPLDRAFQP